MAGVVATRAAAPVAMNGHFTITRTGLQIVGSPSLEECAEYGYQLATLEHAVQFAIGDFILYVEATFGERGSQVVDPDCGWTEDSLRVYRWVAEKVPPAMRRPELSYRHHQLVARLPPATQQRRLEQAATHHWSSAELGRALRKGDAPDATECWLLVLCKDAADRTTLQTTLEAKGRTCKGVDRTKREAASARTVGD